MHGLSRAYHSIYLEYRGNPCTQGTAEQSVIKANLLPVIHRASSSFVLCQGLLIIADWAQVIASSGGITRSFDGRCKVEKRSALKRGRRELDGCGNPQEKKEALLIFFFHVHMPAG